jgi:GNAT superfamily N-acetyltransferase
MHAPSKPPFAFDVPMSAEARIRTATIQDLADPCVGGADGEYQLLLDRLIRDPAAHVLLAEAGGSVVGRICLVIKAGVCELSGLVVAGPQRQRGHGTLLLHGGEDVARTSGCSATRLTVGKLNSVAQSWYLREGYRQIGDGLSEGLMDESGRVVHAREPVWVMEKTISNSPRRPCRLST